jgi:hypothetical protein
MRLRERELVCLSDEFDVELEAAAAAAGVANTFANI